MRRQKRRIWCAKKALSLLRDFRGDDRHGRGDDRDWETNVLLLHRDLHGNRHGNRHGSAHDYGRGANDPEQSPG